MHRMPPFPFGTVVDRSTPAISLSAPQAWPAITGAASMARLISALIGTTRSVMQTMTASLATNVGQCPRIVYPVDVSVILKRASGGHAVEIADRMSGCASLARVVTVENHPRLQASAMTGTTSPVLLMGTV